MKLKKNVRTLVLEALGKRMAEVLTALDEHRDLDVVEFMQKGLLTYEDLVEPSKFNLEEIKKQHDELKKVLQQLQADKIGTAMQDVACLAAGHKISWNTSRALYDLIEDYMNNREVYE